MTWGFRPLACGADAVPTIPKKRNFASCDFNKSRGFLLMQRLDKIRILAIMGRYVVKPLLVRRGHMYVSWSNQRCFVHRNEGGEMFGRKNEGERGNLVDRLLSAIQPERNKRQAPKSVDDEIEQLIAELEKEMGFAEILAEAGNLTGTSLTPVIIDVTRESGVVDIPGVGLARIETTIVTRALLPVPTEPRSTDDRADSNGPIVLELTLMSPAEMCPDPATCPVHRDMKQPGSPTTL